MTGLGCTCLLKVTTKETSMARPVVKLETLKKKFARKINATHKQPRKVRYPEELKTSVVHLIKSNRDITKYQVAKELGINYSLIHSWCKAA
jgi:predicted HTH transcriptional regulator